jgi:hypothetical protein
MRVLCIGWAVVATLAVLLKLFTFEFTLTDDPTSGLAVRAVPSLVSHEVRPTSASAGFVLIQGENGFPLSGLYESIVDQGWIVLVVLWPALVIYARKNR